MLQNFKKNIPRLLPEQKVVLRTGQVPEHKTLCSVSPDEERIIARKAIQELMVGASEEEQMSLRVLLYSVPTVFVLEDNEAQRFLSAVGERRAIVRRCALVRRSACQVIQEILSFRNGIDLKMSAQKVFDL